MFGAFGGSLHKSSLTFVSGSAFDRGIGERLQLAKTLAPVSNVRHVRKSDLVHNNYQPQITVDPETYVVQADGQTLTCEPATSLPMAQRYFLF
jgi:urease subunit alpha